MEMASALVQILWITLVSVNVFTLCRAMPADWPIRSEQDFEESPSFRAFAGKGPDGRFEKLIDLQEIKLIENEWAVVTSRNYIFVLDLKNIGTNEGDVIYSQLVPWLPENTTLCLKKASDPKKCNNFIRVTTPMTQNFLVCGTNALNPKCREYTWNGTQFIAFLDGDRYTDENKCPWDDEPSLAYIYSDGNLYTATKIGSRRNPSVRRTVVDGRIPPADFGVHLRTSSGSAVARDEPLPHISTDNNDESLLNEPVFVSAIETAEKILVFFREVAMEQFGNGEMVFSRVAQVCKNDRGGSKNFRKNRWTSYFKARLNCSTPGRRPFYFNELQQVTRKIVLNGVPLVFAVMTTPTNSILGSAVCAYSMDAIETAMNGDFMKRTSHDTTSVCWSKHGQNSPSGDHPSRCPEEGEDTRTMTNEKLKFRENHPLMKSAVQPITDAPLFMRTQGGYIFTSIDTEVSIVLDHQGRNLTILYIGTNDGRLLTIVPYPFDGDDRYATTKKRENGAFVQELFVYKIEKCKPPSGKGLGTNEPEEFSAETEGEENLKQVMSVTAVEDRDVVLVAFRHCVVTVPKQFCSDIQCRKNCVQSGNPYCGWLDGSCVVVTPDNKDKVEQDIFAARTDLTECSEGTTTSTTSKHSSTVEKSECSAGTSFALPLAISMTICFIVVLVVFVIVIKCREATCCNRHADERSKAKATGRHQSYTTTNPSWTVEEKSDPPIYKGPRSKSQKRSGSSPTERQNQFRGNPSSSSYIAYNMEDTSDSATFDDDISPSAMYASVDSSFSESTPSGGRRVKDDEQEDRRKFHGVHIVEGVSNSSRSSRNSGQDPNLNNNNTKNKNIGIAYALNRTETPVRRRSVSSIEKDQSLNTSTRICVGTNDADECQTPPLWRSQQPRLVTNPNYIHASPKPSLSRCKSQDSQRYLDNSFEFENRRNSYGIPKPPVNGVTSSSPQQARMVSAYSNVANSQNRTFGRGSSLPSYNRIGHDSGPDYENVIRQTQTVKVNPIPKPPTPPPPNRKPSKTLSSFTTSHFNTSWFPAGISKDEYGTKNDDYLIPNGSFTSSTSGIMSASSSSSGNYINQDSPAQNTRKYFDQNKDLAAAKDEISQTREGRILHESFNKSRVNDEGYGSGFICNEYEQKKKSSMSDHRSGSPSMFSKRKEDNARYRAAVATKPPPSGNDCTMAEESEEQWRRTTLNETKNKTGISGDGGKSLKRKKSFKKTKKNTDKRSLVLDLSSPSDSEKVFQETNLGQNEGRSFQQSAGRCYERNGQTLDDSFVDCHSKDAGAYENKPGQYAFYTMRPPGRMRQKLPRLRCSEKESEATLIAVPTPEIPKL